MELNTMWLWMWMENLTNINRYVYTKISCDSCKSATLFDPHRDLHTSKHTVYFSVKLDFKQMSHIMDDAIRFQCPIQANTI